MDPEPPLHVAVGNLNIDLTLYIERFPRSDESVIINDILVGPGGSAANYSVAVTCYGHRSALIASTSTMSYVDEILEMLREKGVDISYVKRVEERPGTVVVIVKKNGERIMFKYRGANELLSPNDLPRELLLDASIVHLTSIPPNIAGEIADRASHLGLLVSYDPGVYVSSSRKDVIKILDKINILFLNRVEAKQLSGTDPSSLLKYGVDIVVVKKGAGGAYLIQHGNIYYYGVSKPLKEPVNTTGAGDAFDAFFNSAYLDFKDYGKALSYALTAGALKTMYKTSLLVCDRELFSKQLKNTRIEIVKEPEEWVLED